MPRYRRYFCSGQAVFLSIVTRDRVPWMAVEGVWPRVLAALRATRDVRPFRHHGHVLLPDHLHLLLSPRECANPSAIVGSFKRAAAIRVRGVSLVPRVHLWQPRFYDHIIRDADDFARHLDYVHFNPVKHGLVAQAAAWPWSSFAEWQRRGVYANDRGGTEPVRIAGMSE